MCVAPSAEKGCSWGSAAGDVNLDQLSASLTAGQLLEDIRGGLEGFGLLADAEPHQLRTGCGVTVKRRTGYNRNSDLAYEVLREIDIVRKSKRGDIAHDVVGPV